MILMHVYFDSFGEIRAITPSPDDTQTDLLSYVFPLSVVENFLTSVSNPADYRVKIYNDPTGKKYKIEKKIKTVNYVRNLDSYLTKLDDEITGTLNTVIIINDTSKKKFTASISKDFKDLYHMGVEEEQKEVSRFLESGLITVYITKKNDPYSLLFSFNLSPNKLFELNTIAIKYDIDCKSSSAYAKKVIGGYLYLER
jgi:hypothetical protein